MPRDVRDVPRCSRYVSREAKTRGSLVGTVFFWFRGDDIDILVQSYRALLRRAVRL